MKKLLSASFLIFSAVSLCSCTKSSSGSEGGGGGGGASDGNFRSDCGTVLGGGLHNPVSPSDGFRVRAIPTGPNTLIINLPSGDALVKLQNIDSGGGASKNAAKSTLEVLSREDAYFFPAGSDCVASLPGGGAGTIGQLFSASGKSYSEMLIKSGIADLESDPCGGEQLDSCYEALADDTASQIAGELEEFLWKPVSDSNGKLAVHSGPYDATVVVAGETGTNQGSGNGFGSLARFTKPGCSYGANVQVQVKDSEGRPYTVNGSRTITIPNGCNRYCLTGGQIVQCVKG